MENPVPSNRRIDTRWLGRLAFPEALDLQERLLRQRLSGEIPDTILLLEHEPVYTIGRTADQSSLKDVGATSIPVVQTNRGGQATYHGPGQLVGYLILDLDGLGRDLHRYLRTLEQGLIDSCAALGIQAARRPGLTGVWVAERKLASIGVGVRKWVTMHGFAINVSADLSGFDSITPCGIQGVSMTSIARELQRSMGVQEFAEISRPHLEQAIVALATPP